VYAREQGKSVVVLRTVPDYKDLGAIALQRETEEGTRCADKTENYLCSTHKGSLVAGPARNEELCELME